MYGVRRLDDAMKAAGIAGAHRVIVGDIHHPSIRDLVNHAHVQLKDEPRKEGFIIATSADDHATVIAGADDSGTLYGCLELAQRIEQSHQFPSDLRLVDAPTFVIRGPCIGMQKTYILPGRKVYEYPYTPQLFQFFYDKSFWTEYLDMLAANRMNTLYIWSGQPFSSLVKVPEYPEALEVSDEVFKQNVEMYKWIVREADRRGIWVVQMFYSILVPKPLADKLGIETQLAEPNPTVNDYTRKAIAQFVEDYPDVGVMVCLGEALRGIDNQRFWLTDVVLAGVKDAMAKMGMTEEPPVVVRTHATDLRQILPDALKIYHNIYTEEKFNGESLTTWQPRGVRQELHLAMSKLVPAHIINVHILANLEPFRYGAQRFIKLCMQAARDRLGAKGLHLYPLSYWNWPDAPDKTDPPLKQYRRDWIWFEAWARYAWNPDIDETVDHAYWIKRVGDMYGDAAAENILAAYNDSGECAPRILRRFGITEGNRQTLSLGMTLDELVNPKKYNEFTELWESQSPPGERLGEYAEREWKHEPHEGETPSQIISEVLDFSKKAVDEIDAAEPGVTKNRDEFERLKNDVHCIREMSQCYADKANAALLVLRYNYSHDVGDMEKAATFLASSLDHFKALTALTKDTYNYANSMQTSQRKIPAPGGSGGKPANYHWTQLVDRYERELTDFRANVAKLKEHEAFTAPAVEAQVKPLPKAAITLLTKDAETFEVKAGAKVFTDRSMTIQSVAPELVGQTGVRFSYDVTAGGKYEPIAFETTEPVQILVGYFRSNEKQYLQVPTLETDALAAEHGGGETLIENAATIPSLPAVDVHALKYDAGRHTLDVRGNGAFVVLGVVPQSATIAPHENK
jgi:hypothetical protein